MWYHDYLIDIINIKINLIFEFNLILKYNDIFLDMFILFILYSINNIDFQ